MSLIIRSSSIHAAGCYTTAAIPAGTRVLEYTGRRVTAAEGDELYCDKEYTYLFALDDGNYVDGYGMAMYVNHSCDPNCESEELDGRIWITTLRDIAASEELTYDYYLFDGTGEEVCHCGAKTCRGTMYSEEEIKKRKREQLKASQRKALRKKSRARRAA